MVLLCLKCPQWPRWPSVRSLGTEYEFLVLHVLGCLNNACMLKIWLQIQYPQCKCVYNAILVNFHAFHFRSLGTKNHNLCSERHKCACPLKRMAIIIQQISHVINQNNSFCGINGFYDFIAQKPVRSLGTFMLVETTYYWLFIQ